MGAPVAVVTAAIEKTTAKVEMVAEAAVEVNLVSHRMPGCKPNSCVPPPPPLLDVDFGESTSLQLGGSMLCAAGDACSTFWLATPSSPTDDKVSSIWAAQLGEATHVDK